MKMKYFLRCWENGSPEVVQAMLCDTEELVRKAVELRSVPSNTKVADLLGLWLVQYPGVVPVYHFLDAEAFKERYHEINVEEVPLSQPIERSFGMTGEDHQFVQWIEHVRSLTGGLVTDFSWRDCYRLNLTPEQALQKFIHLAAAHVKEIDLHKPKSVTGILSLLTVRCGITDVTLEQIDAYENKLINHGMSLQREKDKREKELTDLELLANIEKNTK